jgi:hypothetical protein
VFLRHTTKCGVAVLFFFIVSIQIPLSLEFLLPDPVGFIPMEFGEPQTAVLQTDACDSLHFTPATLPIELPKTTGLTNLGAYGDRLNSAISPMISKPMLLL